MSRCGAEGRRQTSAHKCSAPSQRQHKRRIDQPRDPLLGGSEPVLHATAEEIGQSGSSSAVMATLSVSTTAVQHLLPVRGHPLVHLAGFPRRHMLPVSPSSSVCFSSCSVAPGCCVHRPFFPPPCQNPRGLLFNFTDCLRGGGKKKPV